MADLPVIGAQLSVLDLDRHRDWLFEKDRDLELPEFSMPDILRAPGPFIDMARKRLDGWHGRLGLHGPFSGFDLGTRDPDVRALVQTRLDQALDVCGALGAVQMVVHSPLDLWDDTNRGNIAGADEKQITALLAVLGPALARAEEMGVTLVLENIKDVSPDQRARVVAAAASRALKLSVDIGHAHWAHVTCGGATPGAFIAAAGPDLAHVHLQDADGLADRHWCLGEGNIDLAAVFDALDMAGNAPHLIVEINEFARVPEAVAHLAALGLGQ